MKQLRAPSSNPLTPALLRKRLIVPGAYELLFNRYVVAIVTRVTLTEWRWGLAEGIEFTKPHPPARTGSEETLAQAVETVGWRIAQNGVGKAET